MSRMGNTAIRYPVVLALATLLIIPLIRPSQHRTIPFSHTQKLKDFVKQVSFESAQNTPLPNVVYRFPLDSVGWKEFEIPSNRQVLNWVIPGIAIVDPISEDTLIGWSCSSCNSQSLLDPISEWFDSISYISFPFARNYTRLIDHYSLRSSDSTEQKLIAFSTSSQEFAAGRFSGGVLGLILLELRNGHWTIKAFNPSVMYQGSFGSAQGITTILQSKSFGNLLLVQVNAIEDAALDDCNSVVEDRYLIDAETLKPILRIPAAEKLCRWATGGDSKMDFPNWTTQLRINSRGDNEIDLILDVEGMYMTANDLSPKRQGMGLLTNLQEVLKKQYPDKFQSVNQTEVPSGQVSANSAEAKTWDSTTSRANNDNTTSLVPYFIPYKAKLQTTLKRNSTNIDKEIALTPWKIDWLLN